MIPKILLLLPFVFICNTSIYAQNKSDWGQKLSSCEIQIPIKGNSKNDARDQKIAKKYEGIEIIWLHFEKSIKKVDSIQPIRVFLISEKMDNGRMIEYIIPVEDYKNNINAAIFPEWRSKKNKFYAAKCFYEIYNSK